MKRLTTTARRVSARLKGWLTGLTRWFMDVFEWGPLSPYRALIMFYLGFKSAAPSDGGIGFAPKSGAQLYMIFSLYYLQLFYSANAMRLLLFSPCLLITSFYISPMSQASHPAEMVARAGLLLLYCLLCFRELAAQSQERERPGREATQLRGPSVHTGLLDHWRSLSLESRALWSWIPLSMLLLSLLGARSDGEPSLTSLESSPAEPEQLLALGSPYLLFLLIIIAACLKGPSLESVNDRQRLKAELRRDLSLGLLISVVTALIYSR